MGGFLLSDFPEVADSRAELFHIPSCHYKDTKRTGHQLLTWMRCGCLLCFPKYPKTHHPKSKNITPNPNNPKNQTNTQTVCLHPTRRRFCSDRGPFDDVLVLANVAFQLYSVPQGCVSMSVGSPGAPPVKWDCELICP